ncbi:MAG: dockerin type I domain-containing protein [Phycisphaeraceae bacterium]|nr:dockerin type I domain-containing protein [Phycisphaeraceae bacterium]
MNGQSETNPETTLPEPLIEDLKKLHEPPVHLEASVDRRILNEAGRVLSDSDWRPTGFRVRRWAAAAAAVAATGVGLATWLLVNRTGPPPAPAVAAAGIEDLDRNGRIDMLDAFALARRLESAPEPTAPDLNGDGRVDRLDLDVLAARAVRLKGGH